MLLAEPQPTSADVHFEIAGIPIRVSGWFWVGATLLGFCQSFAAGDQRALLGYLIVWAGTVLVSLVVHELGHALAFRFFGQAAQIVIYHFGGLAIPSAWGRRRSLRPLERLLVSAAGPAAQLLLAAAVVVGLRSAGYAVPFPIAAIGLSALVGFLLFVNVFWPLLNLLPVPPLDGGQIVREGMLALGISDAHRIAGMIGVAVGALVAYWAYTHQEPFLGIMFALLAASCWQGLAAGGGRWR